jgi:aryl-alcohol dehydrogenase-like predicted oxidoreductase
MHYRPLGRTGVQVSALSLGSMLFGGATTTDDAAQLIDMALDRGVNSIDTANVYGRGASEEAVGAALRGNGRRDRVVLATKVHARMDDDDPNAAGNSRRHVIDQCHASLRRLGVDHLDVYYVHRPSTEVPIDETLRALTDLVRAGKVRYIGASSFAAARAPDQLGEQLAALDVVLAPADLARLDAVSPPGRAIVPYYLDDDFADWSAHRHRW